ncbi:MAG: 30S ribosomal protein S9 [Candidatus Nanoarchaeia archaeon]
MPKQSSGTRKKAVARVTLREGKGRVRINKNDISTIQPLLARQKLQEPLWLVGDVASTVDLDVQINGGGVISQAEAGRVAIARAFVAYSKKLEKSFLDYDRNMLVPDSRQKEARKPNTHGRARAKKPKGKR